MAIDKPRFDGIKQYGHSRSSNSSRQNIAFQSAPLPKAEAITGTRTWAKITHVTKLP